METTICEPIFSRGGCSLMNQVPFKIHRVDISYDCSVDSKVKIMYYYDSVNRRYKPKLGFPTLYKFAKKEIEDYGILVDFVDARQGVFWIIEKFIENNLVNHTPVRCWLTKNSVGKLMFNVEPAYRKNGPILTIPKLKASVIVINRDTIIGSCAITANFPETLTIKPIKKRSKLNASIKALIENKTSNDPFLVTEYLERALIESYSMTSEKLNGLRENQRQCFYE